MSFFTMTLAGIPVRVRCIYDSTERFCEKYLTDTGELPKEDAFVDISVTESDIAAERGYSDTEGFSDEYLERLALYRKIANEFVDYNVLLMHGAVIVNNGKAYMFTARSGTGKSTHCRLWLEHVPGSYILNGDKPLIKIEGGQVFACGTPWQGKENYGVNEILPLDSIVILDRGRENSIERIGFGEAFKTVFAQSYHPYDAMKMKRILSLMGKLGEKVSFYHLYCNMEPEAAHVSAGILKGKAEERAVECGGE